MKEEEFERSSHNTFCSNILALSLLDLKTYGKTYLGQRVQGLSQI